MKIRKYKSTDYKEIADLFYETIHSVCVNDYSKEELEAWAPTPIDYKKWRKRLDEKKPFLAVVDNKIVGFAEIENDGHIDCFYVHKDYQGQGVGALIFNHIHTIGKNYEKLYAEVSITAKPFFLKHGFKVIKENIVHINNQKLTNFIMEKQLTKK